MSLPVQEPQKHPGVEQGLNEPEALPGLKRPDAEHDKVEEHAFCRDIAEPVDALQGEDQGVQPKIEKRKDQKENSRRTDCTEKLSVTLVIVFIQDKETAENIKRQGSGPAEIPHRAPDCPRKAEGQHADRGHQQQLQAVGAKAVKRHFFHLLIHGTHHPFSFSGSGSSGSAETVFAVCLRR